MKAWAMKENALRLRMARTSESLNAHSRPLRPLSIGEKVFLQNQQGPSPKKWDRSGTIVETQGHDQYRVKVDGSGHLTLQNRRFLCAYTPATPFIHQQPPMNTTNTKETTRDTTAPMADTLPRKETTQDTTAPTADTLPTSPERQPASPQADSPTHTPNLADAGMLMLLKKPRFSY